ncbi:MAG TPA: hypothetical protein VKA60_13560 [Blastocatellia bacterium]|nr:hypothetical protein [Blastocatellia bacterium]
MLSIIAARWPGGPHALSGLQRLPAAAAAEGGGAAYPFFRKAIQIIGEIFGAPAAAARLTSMKQSATIGLDNWHGFCQIFDSCSRFFSVFLNPLSNYSKITAVVGSKLR